MFGSEQIQHADSWLKANPNDREIAFVRTPEGHAQCFIQVRSDDAQNVYGEGSSLLDALKDALSRAGIK